MKRKKVFILSLCLYILPVILGLMFYQKMPEIMAVHFNSKGIADGFMSKNIALFGIPAFVMAIEIFAYYVTKLDPRRDYQGEKVLNVLLIFLPVLTTIIIIYLILFALGFKENINKIVFVLLGVLFIMLGNYLPKTKRNNTIGIRIPWTMKDDDNWNKTHKLAGYLQVIGGAMIVVLNSYVYLALAIVVIIIIVPIIYSYVIYNKR